MQLPKGTHQWSSFVTPEELVLILQRASITVSGLPAFLFSAKSLSNPISMFLRHSEMVILCIYQVQEMAGFVYNPLTGRWFLSDDISVNYIALGTKPANSDETLD